MLLLIHCCFYCFEGSVFGPCFVVQFLCPSTLQSSLGKRELVALL